MLDPFGGSGTTFVAAELLQRRWIGSELDCSAVVERFNKLEADAAHLKEIQANKNVLFTKTDLDRRRKKGVTPLSKDYRIEQNGCLCEADHDEDQPSAPSR